MKYLWKCVDPLMDHDYERMKANPDLVASPKAWRISAEIVNHLRDNGGVINGRIIAVAIQEVLDSFDKK